MTDYVPEISSINVRLEPLVAAGVALQGAITISLQSGAVAELTNWDEAAVVHFQENHPEVDLRLPVFWFNRLVTAKQGRGDGTLLMETLVKILDENHVTVINYVHPYKRKDFKRLVKFYERYGFKIIDKSTSSALAVRYPKEQS